MKKHNILKLIALVIAIATVLSCAACIKIGSNVDDPEATEANQVDVKALARAIAFAMRFSGTWTSADGYFYDFDLVDGEPKVLFSNWNLDGKKAYVNLLDASEKSEGEYVLTIEDEKSGSYKVKCQTDNNGIIVSADGFSERYEYTSKQYPPEVNKLTKNQILENIGGVRTDMKDGKKFIHVFADETNEDVIWLATGEWKDEGGYENYAVRYRINDVEADEMWSELKFKLEDDKGNAVSCPGAFYGAEMFVAIDLGDGMVTYNVDSFDNHKELSAEQLADRRAKEFGFRAYGTWTATNGMFLSFDFEDGALWFMAAVWNSGGEFPSGHIIDAVEEAPNDYRLSVIMRGETTPVTMHCLFKDDMIKFTDNDGEQETFTFYENKQYPEGSYVRRGQKLISAIGSLRTDYAEKKEYLYFHLDENVEVRLDVGEWGKTELKASYRVPCATETWGLHQQFTLILVDEDYNITKVSGGVYSINDLLQIDVGFGVKSYIEDSFDNH